MDVEKLSHYGSRAFFLVAVFLFVVAAVDWILALLKMKSWLGYMPGRLLEFAAMCMLPVITVLLRQIREELRKQRSA